MWKRVLSPIIASKRAKRTITTLSNVNVPKQGIELPAIDLQEERCQFEKVYPEFMSALLPKFTEPCLQEILHSHKMSIDYNVHLGKKNRGIATVLTYKLTASSDEEMHLARIMGWTMELLQAYLVMLDDIQDQSYIRRGKKCWFRKEEIGLRAVNDASLLYFGIFAILQRYFCNKQYYVPVMQLFNDVRIQLVIVAFQTAAKTTFGQNLDGWPCNISEFTQERFETITKYKTGYYSFYLPVAAALHMAGMQSEVEREDLVRILLQMGYLFQAQDDFYDCYGDPKVTGKIGTDIKERKCTWLVVKAFENASVEQMKILKENYGRGEEHNIGEVRKVYDELNLKNMFYPHATDVHADLLQQIHQLDNQRLQHCLQYMLDFVYMRPS